jgi:hypothetical protein
MKLSKPDVNNKSVLDKSQSLASGQCDMGVSTADTVAYILIMVCKLRHFKKRSLQAYGMITYVITCQARPTLSCMAPVQCAASEHYVTVGAERSRLPAGSCLETDLQQPSVL